MEFKVVAVNSQGYFEDQLNQFMNGHREKPDVLIIPEHKQRSLDTIKYSIANYVLAAGYPASTGQRGSAVFVKDCLDNQPRPDLDSFSREGVFEASSVEVNTPGANLVVTGLYRSPKSSVTEHNRILDSFAKYINSQFNKTHVIGGDININWTINNSTSPVLSDNSLSSHIRSATYDRGRCLDNFITPVDSGCSGRRLSSTFSDHRPIQLLVPLMPHTVYLGRPLGHLSGRRGRARESTRRRNSSRSGGRFPIVNLEPLYYAPYSIRGFEFPL